MKATGIVRRIDPLGRVVIPKEIRRTFGWAEGDPVEMYTSGECVILKKYPMELCAKCGTEIRDGYRFCPGCGADMQAGKGND